MMLDKFEVSQSELHHLSERARGYAGVLTLRETELQQILDGEIVFGDSKAVMGNASALRMIDVSGICPGEDPILCGEVKEDIANPEGIWLCAEEPLEEMKTLPVVEIN